MQYSDFILNIQKECVRMDGKKRLSIGQPEWLIGSKEGKNIPVMYYWCPIVKEQKCAGKISHGGFGLSLCFYKDLFANALCRTISRLKDTFSSLFWLCSSALCENSNTIPFVALQMLCQVLETKQTLMKSKGNHQAYFSSHLQDKNDL